MASILTEKKEKGKKRKVEDVKGDSRNSTDDTHSLYPYQVVDDDHCETPVEAYADIADILTNLACVLGKTKESLCIYDPFFCEGMMIERMKSLGFSNVYNKKEDFYDSHPPPYDVLVTNPPYSGDHMKKLLIFCAESNKPFLLLLPNYVYTKDYYIPAISSIYNSLFYLTPTKRYLYSTPKGRRQLKSSKITSPFPTFWYCFLHHYKEKILSSIKEMKLNQQTSTISRSLKSLPLEICPDNDPRRKKLRNALKRKKHKKRKADKPL